MNKFIVLIFSMVLLCSYSYAQRFYNLQGFVIDENNKPLIGASVFLKPGKKGTITDTNGSFVINNIASGKYIVEVSFIGYKRLIDSLFLFNNETKSFQLLPDALSLQEVVITDNYAESRKKQESLNIEIANSKYLKQNLGGSLMNSLERLPGVSAIDIGSGQSKPVIRGLGFNRVVVVENNIKHEAQQWGADHGLEIDQYAIGNVEIIKGPASLIYGSDAIGGVIDMKNKKLPLKNSFGGTIDLTAKSNNNFIGTSILLFGRKDQFYTSFRATLIDYGDYKVPTDTVDIYGYRPALYKNHLRNTAGKEQNLHLTFGIINQNFKSRFYLSSVNSKSGFFANAHGLDPLNADTLLHDKSDRDIQNPYQLVNHYKITNSTQFNVGYWDIESNFGYQFNHRQEWSDYTSHLHMPAIFPDTLNFSSELERQFNKQILSGNIKFKYRVNNKINVSFGVDSEHQNNYIDGRGFLIPEFKQLTMGAFSYAKYLFSETSILSTGIRYDYGNVKTQEYFDWYPSEEVNELGDTTMRYLQRVTNISSEFSSISWSIGYNYNPGKWSYKANIGKSFRMPDAKELAANGVNYHYYRYEIGKTDLLPEISLQLDGGVEFNGRKFAIGTTPFLNYFSNYIYLNPSVQRIDALQVFYYTQSKVLRYGTEIHAHFEPIKQLQFGLIGEYVYSEQISGEKKGFTLPFSPPPSGIINIKYTKQKVKFIENTYLSVDYRITAPQKNIVPPEEKTEGYQVINIGLGGDININKQIINVSLQIKNLLNTKYLNHTSFYRLINVPEPGRNFIVNISVPFSGKLKQK